MHWRNFADTVLTKRSMLTAAKIDKAIDRMPGKEKIIEADCEAFHKISRLYCLNCQDHKSIEINSIIFKVNTKNRIYVGVWSITEKAMAPRSSTLAWKIPWTEEPGRLLFLLPAVPFPLLPPI